MAEESPWRLLHHDLRSSLAAVSLNLDILGNLEETSEDEQSARRLALLDRAHHALMEAAEQADRLLAEVEKRRRDDTG